MTNNVAVVIFNLGGPESLSAVQPFLFNLFNDKHIIPLFQPLRFIVASMISNLEANGKFPNTLCIMYLGKNTVSFFFSFFI